MKVRMRFIKRGPIQYIGHLDLMRYFQKVFRRCGLDVAYSQGFNPHQLLSFASPLGVGLTSIGEYLDATINSLRIITDENKCQIGTDEWINRINEYSNDMVIVTTFNIMPDDIKPSMSLLDAASYAISFASEDAAVRIREYYNSNTDIIITKKTKKSTKDINLKDGIYLVEDSESSYYEQIGTKTVSDIDYEREYIKYMDCNNALYMLCSSGSALNIKPEMLIEAYEQSTCESVGDYNIIRLDMYYKGESVYESMSTGKATE